MGGEILELLFKFSFYVFGDILTLFSTFEEWAIDMTVGCFFRFVVNTVTLALILLFSMVALLGDGVRLQWS